MESVIDFKTIVKETELLLFQYAYRILNNHELTRDIIQEAFLRLYKELTKADTTPIKNSTAWLYTITRNLCLDHKRLKRNKMEMLLDADGSMDDFVGVEDSPAKVVIKQEKLKIMKKAIDNLSEREREVIMLKIEHDKSYREIAEIMDISSSNVGFILHTAMNKLKSEVKCYWQV